MFAAGDGVVFIIADAVAVVGVVVMVVAVVASVSNG